MLNYNITIIVPFDEASSFSCAIQSIEGRYLKRKKRQYQ